MPSTQSYAPDAGFNAMLSSINDPAERYTLSKMDKQEQKSEEFGDTQLKKLDDLKKPERPTLPTPPKAQDYQTDPMQTFGSASMVLATLGSLLTRAPLTNALKSGAEVMNAVSQKNSQAFKSAYDKWKTDSDYAIKLSNYDLDAYKEAISQGDAETRLYAATHKNDAARDALMLKDSQNHLKALETANKNASQGINYMKQAADSAYDEAISAGKSPKEASEAAMAEILKGKGRDANNITGQKIDFSTLKPEDIVPGTGISYDALKRKVETLHNTGNYAAAGLSMRTSKNPQKDAAEDLWSKLYPNDDASAIRLQYSGEQTGEKIGAKNFENMTIATNNLDNSIPLLMEQVKAVNPGQFKSWNEFENYLDENAGDPKIVALQQTVEDTKSDFQQVLAKGGQLTDNVRNKSDRILNSAWATGQFESAVNIMKKTSENQMEAAKKSMKDVGKMHEESTGGLAGKPPDEKHLKMLKDDPSEENKKYFDEAFGEGAAAKVLGK